MKNKTTYNPDVLNCLANLSNDEVFTPPALANQVLDMLPQELFRDPKTKFLDPVSKSGVFLREIVKRLDRGLATVIPDRQQRIDHIMHNQVYGVAITELTSHISRRSLYCSMRANSEYSVSQFPNPEGNVKYKALRHTWNTNGKCIYCGASKEVYERTDADEQYAYLFLHTDNPERLFPNMKFDVIIGNPPYQLSDGGGSNQISAKPIYNLFVNQAKKLNPRHLCMIIPSRWFAGGKGLDDFRKEMLNDKNLVCINHFPKSRECFQGVDIAGGVCYFLRTKGYNGLCKFTTTTGEISSTRMRALNEYPILIADNIGVDVINKVKSISNFFYNDRVLPRNSFGFTSSARGKSKPFEGCISLISSEGVSYETVGSVTKNKNLLNKYKISVGTLNPDRGGVNNASDGMSNVTTKVRILNPNEVVTETYIVVDTLNTRVEAENCATYMRTKFVRYLILLTVSSMHIVRENYQFVPLQDFSHPWTDDMLYKKYNLDEKEIAFIESMIRPME